MPFTAKSQGPSSYYFYHTVM